jgi:hypothetical protein
MVEGRHISEHFRMREGSHKRGEVRVHMGEEKEKGEEGDG